MIVIVLCVVEEVPNFDDVTWQSVFVKSVTSTTITGASSWYVSGSVVKYEVTKKSKEERVNQS